MLTFSVAISRLINIYIAIQYGSYIATYVWDSVERLALIFKLGNLYKLSTFICTNASDDFTYIITGTLTNVVNISSS